MIPLDKAVELVWKAFEDAKGGEIYVRKIPSMNICDIANAISPAAKQKIVGIRPGEKLHEQMIGPEDAPYTYEFDNYYKILPAINNWDDDPDRISSGNKVPENFCYSSDNNSEWMTVEELKRWIDKNKDLIGKI
jgi:FlaA1/EpsC-like NDP-sugar epimerase